MNTDELDYPLPPEAIAARPAEPRDHSRLLVYRRDEDRVEHRHFYDLPEYLRPTDLLVVNDTRVIPAKLELKKVTGAAVPGLFVRELEPGRWEVMLRTRGKLKPGDRLLAATAETTYQFLAAARAGEKGMWILDVAPPHQPPDVLARIGHVPLPPYIEKMRSPEEGDDEAFDKVRYQTVYAKEGRSLAAPTAGLHFTPELLAQVAALGVRRVAVTLEVGLGNFLPIETATLEEHPMHTESYIVPADTAAALRAQRASTGRIVVVGTTAARTLESASVQILAGQPESPAGATNLFIRPGYPFALTDVLVTNFHLPRSTLIALVGAMVGLAKVKELYARAVAEKYRFYSYGDAMLILP